MELPNRVVMAPLTRRRATDDGVPTESMARHYADRAGTGLIVAEGTYPSRRGQTYLNQPGIADAAQAAGWRRVTDAVHERGGRIVLQVMHGGRVVHLPDGAARDIVAPSAIPVPGTLRLPDGERPFYVPRALRTDEMPAVVEEFVAAARRAIDAGFDGVEVHGANGYLLNQFLSPTTNQRTDAYGGSPANRARLVVEVTRAVADAVGADRTGLRISPAGVRNSLDERHVPDVRDTYGALVAGLTGIGLAYLSVLSPDPAGELVQGLRRQFDGALLLNDGFDLVTTRTAAAGFLADGLADAVVVGRPVLANPDLVRRWREDLPLNEPDPATFYGGDDRGYNDYPLADAAAGVG
ncbi:alkene reductase [Georgenia thermotolerans]|uniref:Alkene reductase n=2 Tax=Georgenia thermotolerans TaxID=527326 RepID=A0A7J5USB9_9MICO|nr:alkene reductase [Georgenia thermotolerans]